MMNQAKYENNNELHMSQDTMKSVQVEDAKEKHLLDILAERLGCSYVSDLRQPKYRELAIQELRKGDFEQINVDQLRETLCYLQAP